MNYWKSVIAKNTSDYVENLNGRLVVIGKRGAVMYPFKYATVSNRKYTSNVASFAGEYIQPTETIYTTCTDIPITKNASIKMQDGVILVVQDIEAVNNINTGKLKAYLITLVGGVPDELG